MLDSPKVYSIYDNSRPKWCTFIGRANSFKGRFGNPYTIPPYTRDEACDKFDEMVLPNLEVEALRGKNLVCFCAPPGGSTGEDIGRGSEFRCHGYSILKKANMEYPKRVMARKEE